MMSTSALAVVGDDKESVDDVSRSASLYLGEKEGEDSTSPSETLGSVVLSKTRVKLSHTVSWDYGQYIVKINHNQKYGLTKGWWKQGGIEKMNE